MHVLFPFQIPDDFSRPRQRSGQTRRLAAHRESANAFAVDTDVDLLRGAHSHDVIVSLTTQAHPDDVFAIERKVVANSHAAARPEWQVFADPDVLIQNLGNRVLSEAGNGAHRRVSDGEPADLAGCRHVAFQVRRGELEIRRNVVKARFSLVGQQ